MTTPEGPGGDIVNQPDMSDIPAQLREAPDVWDQTALRLNPGEIAELVDTNGTCVRTAPMREFSSPEEFFEGQNNFWLAFTATGLGKLYREQKHYQRFAILYPDLCIDLVRGDAAIRERMKNGEVVRHDDAWWSLVYEAYKRVSNLVDVRDEDVQKDGQISPYLLLGY